MPLARRFSLLVLLPFLLVFLSESVHAAPAAPVLLSPDNNLKILFKERTLVLDWIAVENAVEYCVHITDDPSLSNDNVYRTENDNYILDLTNLTPGTFYYWWVQAKDNQGELSENSEVRRFRRNCPPRVENLLIEGRPSPAYKLPTSAPLFSWIFKDGDREDAQKGVVIQVGTSPNVTSENWTPDKWNFRNENYTSNSCQYIGYGLERGVTFYFRIQVIDSFGENGPWEYGQFSLNRLPQVSNFLINGQVNPTNLSADRLYFQWDYSDGDGDPQAYYRIMVGQRPGENDVWDSDNKVWDNKWPVGENKKPLLPGTTYYVRIRVSDNLEWSEWVQASFKMNSPPELRKVMINGGARYTSSRTVTLTVDAVDDNVVQTLIVSFDAFQTQLEFPFSSTLNLTLPGGDGAKTVYVVVADDKGSKSTVKENFIVLDQTPPYGIVGVQPPDGAVVGPDLVTISWTIAYDDTSGVALPYVLELSKDRDFSSPIKIECEKNRYDLPYENQRGSYYWRVRVWDKAGNENCTPIYSFTYNLDAPVVNIRTNSEMVNTPEVFIRLSGTNLACYRYALSEHDLYRAPWVVYSGGLENIRLRLLTEGDYRICFEVKSPAGVVAGPIVISLLVDLTPPRVSLAADNLFSTSKRRTLFITAEDRWSGVSEMRLKLGENWSDWEKFENQRTIELEHEGLNSVEVQVRDKAGNVSAVAKLDLYYSTGPPKLEVSIPQMVAQPTYTLTLHALPEVSLYVNGEKVEPVGGFWMVNLRLKEGRNEVVLRTEDPTGQSWENTYVLFYSPKKEGGFPFWVLALLPVAAVAGISLYLRWGAIKRRRMEMQLAAKPTLPFKPEAKSEIVRPAPRKPAKVGARKVLRQKRKKGRGEMRHLLLLPAVAVFLVLLPVISAQGFKELKVLVMEPDGGELWWGYRTIRWCGSCDPPDNVTYRIEISIDGGSSWGFVDEKTFYEESTPTPHEVGFNTSGIDKSTRCLVRVSAKALTWGVENSDTSDNFFTIQNVLPPPKPLYPANESTISNKTPTLTWMDEETPWEIENHLVQISIDPNFTPGRIVWSRSMGKLTSATVDMVLNDGVYYWRVMCVDQRGVQSEWSETFCFEVFAYAPVIGSVSPTKFFVNTRKAQLNIEQQNIIYIQYSLDGGATWSDWEYFTSPFEIKFSENELDGEKTIWIRGKSQGGKLSDIKTTKLCLDTKPPLVTPEFSGVLGEGGAYKGSVTIRLRTLDVTSGVDLTQYRVDGGGWENGDTFTIATDGNHEVDYLVRDKAGNVARGSFSVSVYTPLSPVPYMAFFGGTVGIAVFWVFMWKKGIPAIAAWRKQRQLRSKWFQELMGWAEEGGTGAGTEEAKMEELTPRAPRTSPIVESYKEMLMPAAEMLREKTRTAVEKLGEEGPDSLDRFISQLDEVKRKGRGR